MLTAPQIYGDNVPLRMISTKLKRVQRRIVMLHDYFRTKVLPPASNMLSMVSIHFCSWCECGVLIKYLFLVLFQCN